MDINTMIGKQSWYIYCMKRFGGSGADMRLWSATRKPTGYAGVTALKIKT